MNDEQIRQHPAVVRLLLEWDRAEAYRQSAFNELQNLDRQMNEISAVSGRAFVEAEEMERKWREVTPDTLPEWAARRAQRIAIIEAARFLQPMYDALLTRGRKAHREELEAAPGQRAYQALALRGQLLDDAGANPRASNRDRQEAAEIGKWLVQLAEAQRPGAYQATIQASTAEREMERLAQRREADEARQRAVERNERERNAAEFARENNR